MQRPVTADGLFVEGNPNTGIKGTHVTAGWFNDIQENICKVVEAAGIALVEGDYTQLFTAIQKLSGGQVTRTVTESGPVLVTDSVLVVDASAGPVTLTLLSAAAANGMALTIMKDDDSGNAVTIQAQVGETLPTSEGRQQEVDLTMQDESIKILPNGVDHWLRVS